MVNECGGPNHAEVLLAPLETLCAVEEGLIRDRAVSSISLVASQMTDASFVEHVLPLARRLTHGDWFTSRMSAASMLPHVLERFLSQSFATFHSQSLPSGVVDFITEFVASALGIAASQNLQLVEPATLRRYVRVFVRQSFSGIHASHAHSPLQTHAPTCIGRHADGEACCL